MDRDVADLTAAELAAMFRRRTLSPVEAAEAALARIRRYNPIVNAFCLVDEATTLEAARAAEERHLRGDPLGELDGVPVAIKDVFLTREWPTLKGSRTVEPDQTWRIDAPAVAALRRHGAVPVGKTTTPEFGWKGVTDNPLDGITRNPWDSIPYRRRLQRRQCRRHTAGYGGPGSRHGRWRLYSDPRRILGTVRPQTDPWPGPHVARQPLRRSCPPRPDDENGGGCRPADECADRAR